MTLGQADRTHLPNLIVPGAGKAGTSSMHEYLGQHDDIFMSFVKEPHYFVSSESMVANRESYSHMFADGRDRAWRGESSTGYLLFPGTAERIAHIIPECRFIVLLRNPVDRAISHYRWMVSLGLERRSFRDAFFADHAETPDRRADRSGNYAYYFQEGCYARNLRPYVALFGRERVLTVLSEDLRERPDAVLAECAEFLGLTPFRRVSPLAANATEAYRFPRMRAYVEGRTTGSAQVRRRLGRIARAAIGDERAQELRHALSSRLDFRREQVPIDVSRSWLANQYADEVHELRATGALSHEVWSADFPAT